MIPHKLHIKNFLSYGPETQIIDFSNYHLICLSGKNGHGKSAMLDAITWAIWGQARKSYGNAKPDAGLLHLGQKHMMVILEFEVNGANYRIRREYLHTASKPFATLDFGISNPDGKLTALTDKTIKDTQEKIERTIGITYESFTNSTFLRQGQSNEFSKKLPKERKEILAQVLQLNQFEQQKKIAMLHARKLQLDWASQNNIVIRIEQELKTLATVHEQQQIITDQIQQLDEQRHNYSILKADLILQAQALLQKNNEYFLLTQQGQNLQKNIEQIQQEIVKIKTLLAQSSAINDGAKIKQEEQELIQLLQRFQQAQHKKLQLKETYLTTKDKLKELIATIQQEFQKNEQKLQLQIISAQEMFNFGQKQLQLEQATCQELKKQGLIFIEQMQQLQTQLKPLENIEILHAQAQELFEKNKTTYQNLCAQSTQLVQQISLLTQQQQQQKHLPHATCLQCEQTITPEQQHKIMNNLALQQSETEATLKIVREQIQNLKIELTTQHAQLQKLKISCNEFILLSTKFEEQSKQEVTFNLQISEQEKKITAQQESLITTKRNVDFLEIELQNVIKNFKLQSQNEEIQYLQKTMHMIEEEVKTLNYDPVQHQQIETKLHQIQKLLQEYQADHDDSAKEVMQLQLKQLQMNTLEIQTQLRTIYEKLKLYENLGQEQQELAQKEQHLDKNIHELEQQHRQLLVQKGTLQHQQKKQHELEKEGEELSKTIKLLYQDLQDYQEIAKALGKDGIQALLIEQAIPEIEHETNQILARLTNNQTQIFIESLRDLKKGGSKETLDIKISDSFGIRDYEMFSGGEAFRIDFALRIGISKLLARRAGTTLQTIFIDEGFGSQDEEGLQLIMDNIYKIQDDFAKIVIVSHLPEMKEQFPVQFVIEKKRSGSTVAVVHQG